VDLLAFVPPRIDDLHKAYFGGGGDSVQTFVATILWIKHANVFTEADR